MKSKDEVTVATQHYHTTLPHTITTDITEKNRGSQAFMSSSANYR
jgi:hypothetical protein